MSVKQKLKFSKKCKNMSTKQEIASDADFKAWSFSSDFVKMVELPKQHANTTVYWL